MVHKAGWNPFSKKEKEKVEEWGTTTVPNPLRTVSSTSNVTSVSTTPSNSNTVVPNPLRTVSSTSNTSSSSSTGPLSPDKLVKGKEYVVHSVFFKYNDRRIFTGYDPNKNRAYFRFYLPERNQYIDNVFHFEPPSWQIYNVDDPNIPGEPVDYEEIPANATNATPVNEGGRRRRKTRKPKKSKRKTSKKFR